MKNILIKTAPSLHEFRYVEQLNSKIEIQLLKSFIDQPDSIEDWFDYLTKESNSEIVIIHSPLNQGDDIDWDDLLEPEILNIVHQTCQLGERLAHYYQRPMPVVFHFGGNTEKIKNTPILKQAYLETIQELLVSYPNVHFYLENVVIVDVNKARGVRRYREADVSTVVDFVCWLREELNASKRFYTVLDTCHALMSIRLLNAINLAMELEEFFKTHQKTCGLIHLANCTNFGFGDDHGTPFTSKDQALLEEIVALYRQYQYDVPVTLELREESYTNYQNYLLTTQTLKAIG